MKIGALRIAEPCPERWEEMTGVARERFCARCELHVHNVSELREAEADALVARRDGRCLHALHDAEGNVVTRTTQERRFLDALRMLAAQRGEGAP